jgi:type I restriction enzyme S subunit
MSRSKKVRIKEITEVITKGTTPSTYGFNFEETGDVNFIRAEGISKDGYVDHSTFLRITKECDLKLKRSRLKIDDILFSIAGMALGKTGIVKQEYLPANTNQAVAIVRPKTDVVFPKFLHYQFINPQFYKTVNSISGQAAQPNINLEQVGNLEIFLPPLPTQRHIGSILSAYDDLIENNLKRIKLLEEIAQRTYNEWFVKFRVNEKPLPFDKNTGLPKGFKLSKFDLHFTINNGYAFKSKDYTNQGIKILRTKDYSQTKWINIEQPIYLSEENSKKYTKYFVKTFDLMLIMVGASIGKYGIVLPKDIGILQNQNQWAIRSKKKLYELYKILVMEDVIINLLTKKTGSARDFFRAEFLKEMDILIPPEDIIIEFNKIIEPIYSQISMLHFQNQLLKESRDTLLPKLMNGTLNVE